MIHHFRFDACFSHCSRTWHTKYPTLLWKILSRYKDDDGVVQQRQRISFQRREKQKKEEPEKAGGLNRKRLRKVFYVFVDFPKRRNLSFYRFPALSKVAHYIPIILAHYNFSLLPSSSLFSTLIAQFLISSVNDSNNSTQETSKGYATQEKERRIKHTRYHR